MRVLPILCLLPLVAGPPPADTQSPTAPPQTDIRGMTISCQGWGGEWGTDEMVEAMRELKALGVNWIAIHPYARIRSDGRVLAPERWYDNPRWLTRPIEEARKLGLKIMIKPHLAYWGSPFRWRGEITFGQEEQWQRFFADYEAWITNVARLCAGADAFVIGTELDRTLHREVEWRRIIAAVRERFGGPLTYAANWTDYEQVPFWDALDVIGIQAYFPLTDRAGLPEPQALDEAWRQLGRRLDAFATRLDRRILLAELGYGRSSLAAMRPWDAREGGEHAEETQRRCLEAALRALDRNDSLIGAFLWKWFPGRTTHENFLMSTPAMQEVIAEYWGSD